MDVPCSNGLSEQAEIDLLLDAIRQRYGYDLRSFAPSPLRVRLRDAARSEQFKTITQLKDGLLSDEVCLERLLLRLSAGSRPMFRDPSFFLAFRTEVVPLLRTYPFVSLWQAGCSAGEELFALAIVLHEEGIYDRCRIYATDLGELALNQAREGSFPLAALDRYAANYREAGGSQGFSDYYATSADQALFDPSLLRNVIFARHNLATDGPFNEFQVIACRDVLLLFRRALRRRAHDLFFRSLVRLGFLCLGRDDSLDDAPADAAYREFCDSLGIYRRMR
jgi:chemotaxis protein methyltransferase CheR